MSCLTFQQCIDKGKGSREVELWFECKQNPVTIKRYETFSCEEACSISLYIKQCCGGASLPPLDIVHTLPDSGGTFEWRFSCENKALGVSLTVRIPSTPARSCKCLLPCGDAKSLAARIDTCCSCGA